MPRERGSDIMKERIPQLFSKLYYYKARVGYVSKSLLSIFEEPVLTTLAHFDWCLGKEGICVYIQALLFTISMFEGISSALKEAGTSPTKSRVRSRQPKPHEDLDIERSPEYMCQAALCRAYFATRALHLIYLDRKNH
jgi:hypothetical protein